MKNVWLPHLDNEAKFTALAVLAALILVGAGFVGNMERRARTFTRTVTHRVGRSYGKPDTTVDGTQINAQLQGFTCDIYSHQQVVLCHR